MRSTGAALGSGEAAPRPLSASPSPSQCPPALGTDIKHIHSEHQTLSSQDKETPGKLFVENNQQIPDRDSNRETRAGFACISLGRGAGGGRRAASVRLFLPGQLVPWEPGTFLNAGRRSHCLACPWRGLPLGQAKRGRSDIY